MSKKPILLSKAQIWIDMGNRKRYWEFKNIICCVALKNKLKSKEKSNPLEEIFFGGIVLEKI